MKNLILLLSLSIIAACNGQGPTSGTFAAPVVTSTPEPSAIPLVTDIPVVTNTPVPTSTPVIVEIIPAVTPTPTPIAVELIYFKLSTYTNPLHDSVFITMTGYCSIYKTKEYCWDDGVHIVHRTGTYSTDFDFTYWGVASNPLINNGAIMTSCSGPCAIDEVIKPTEVDAALALAMNAFMSISSIYGGQEIHVMCTDFNGELTCPNFVIDLNQKPF